MALGSKMLLGGRYKLTGELARADSVRRGWDRWLNRQVFIKILANHEITNCETEGRFIASARALVQIEHPNVGALLDYGATDDGAPYHVMSEAGIDLATLLANEGRVSWVRARTILLDVIAGVRALHRRRIVHGDIAPHTVALLGERARLVEFADAKQHEQEPSAEDIQVDVHGIAALGFTLLTGSSPSARPAATLSGALARVAVPRPVRALLLRALTAPESVDLASLQQSFAASPRFARTRLIDLAAAVAAVTMLMIGLWSSVANPKDFSLEALGSQASTDGATCEFELVDESVGESIDRSRIAEERLAIASPRKLERRSASAEQAPTASQPRFESARVHARVAAEERRAVSVRSDRIDLQHELSPAKLVERGIDLTHGRPPPEDDPRLPIVDGPLRARALFEAACARDYGKGCHMLGVQIAEGMIDDDAADAAEHYRRGCALDYHRSCAALADLARAGQIVADADLLEAKACLLAGPASSYCLPRE